MYRYLPTAVEITWSKTIQTLRAFGESELLHVKEVRYIIMCNEIEINLHMRVEIQNEVFNDLMRIFMDGLFMAIGIEAAKISLKYS